MGNILSMDGICKSFSGIQVLRDVGLELEAGQIHPDKNTFRG